MKKLLLINLILALLISCTKEEEELLSGNDIISFQFADYNVDAVINDGESAIVAYVPESADLTSLIPTIEVSEGAKVFPMSGEPQDFTNTVPYTVTAENGSTNIYTTSIKLEYLGISSFTFQEIEAEPTITENTITFTLPFGTDVTALTPEITLTGVSSTVSPASEITQDFSENVIYTVTAENGTTKEYTVVVNIEEGDNKNTLYTVSIPSLFLNLSNSDNTFTSELPYGIDQSKYIDIKNIDVQLSISAKASIKDLEVIKEDVADDKKEITVNIDINQTKELIVIAENGEEQTYDLQLTIEATNPTAVRGVWVANVGSAQPLQSESKIEEMIEVLDELGFNTIFAVTWNKSMTLHPSEVLKNIYTEAGMTDIPTQFYGETSANGYDPLAVLIEKAHAKNMKVIAWFEYGFAAKWGSYDSSNPEAEKKFFERTILQAKPEWASRDINGGVAEKNDFYWMNGFHPEVQQFMIDLITEVVEKYDVDGIQGDDRLPAMPNTAGHSETTVELYKADHDGALPPTQDANSEWKKWRANILSDFGQNLYDAVKAVDPNCGVTFSPSVYGFSYDNYLQDWPEWINRGIVDVLSPQVYRKEDAGVGSYTSTLDYQLTFLGSLPNEKFSPGMLIMSGGYYPSDQYYADCIRHNRQQGIDGETHFFYDILPYKRELFHALYPVHAVYPAL